MRQARLVLLSAVISLLAAQPVMAQNSAAQTCTELSRQARRVLMDSKTLWEHFRSAGDAAFCRKKWATRSAEEWIACASWSMAKVVGNNTRNKWNRAFATAGAEWATWGPRSIGDAWETGTIRGGFKRAFFGVGLPDTNTTLEVDKLGGNAQARITLCELDYESAVISAQRIEFPNSVDPNGPNRTLVLTLDQPRILGVVVDTPVSVNSFNYRTRLVTTLNETNYPPVRGIADLHVHQLMNLGFAGRMMWGQHDGPIDMAVGPEWVQNLPTGQDLTLGNLLRDKGGRHGIDANVLFAVAMPAVTDEGEFTYGGGGAPDFVRWPRHTDRSHQQVHMDWLREAHTRGADQDANLKLMVVSIVNNDVLCNILKPLDPNGNVPRFNSRGRITDWESANWKCTDHENVMRQINAVHELERRHSWYRVALTPSHARRIIAEGDLAVVLSLETDRILSGDNGPYGDWIAQLDRYRAMGLTTTQIVHESNSLFAGAAPHRNFLAVLQAVHWPINSIGNLFHSTSTFHVDVNGHNILGLRPQGERLIDAMVARHMPIDLAHASVRARLDIMGRVPEGYGLYDSHTKFEHLLRPAPGQTNFGTHVAEREQEFLITRDLVAEYARRRVVVGLRTAAVDVYDAPRAKVANTCPGSARSFAQMVQFAADNCLEIAYGTDINTGVAMTGPRSGTDGCWASSPRLTRDFATRVPVVRELLPQRAQTIGTIAGTNYYEHGLSNIGWLPEMTIDLLTLPTNRNVNRVSSCRPRITGAPPRFPADPFGADKLRDGAEAYLAMWERAWEPAP